MYICLADGFCSKSNCGGSYFCYNLPNITFFDYKDKQTFIQLNNLSPQIKQHKYDHPKHIRTNNCAEAQTIYDCLEHLHNDNILHPANKILLLTDSQICIRLITGIYKCRSPALKDIITQIKNIATRFKVLYDTPIKTCLKLDHISGVYQKAGPIQH